MKKLLFTLFVVTLLSACGNTKVYNSALKQIELGMTQEQVVGLMGKDYTVTNQSFQNNHDYVTLEYVDMYKYHWFFVFEDNYLVKWDKEVGGK